MFKSLFSRLPITRKATHPRQIETYQRVVVSAVCWDIYVDGVRVGAVFLSVTEDDPGYLAYSGSSATRHATQEEAVAYLVSHALKG